MPELSTVLLLALLQASVWPPVGSSPSSHSPKKWLNWSLQSPAGIVIAIAAIEVFPEALDSASPWTVGITRPPRTTAGRRSR